MAQREWQEYEDILRNIAVQRNKNYWKVQEQEVSAKIPTRETRICVASEIQQDVNSAGMGSIFRDERGNVILARAEVSQNIQNPYIAEIEAIRRALIETKRKRIQKVEYR